MPRYSIVGIANVPLRAVRADGPRTAAQTFAYRIARRMYGRRGYPRTLVCECFNVAGTVHEWSAFVGVDSKRDRGATVGRCVRFTVTEIGE